MTPPAHPDRDPLLLARVIAARPLSWSITVFAWCFTAVLLFDRFFLDWPGPAPTGAQLRLVLALTAAGLVATWLPARRALEKERRG